MTKDTAIYRFLSQLMPFYSVSSVPNDVIFPYGTYELPMGALDSGPVSMTVNLWFHTESEAIPNAKAQELSEMIGYGGKVLPCDGGYIWIKRGSPFSLSQSDAEKQEVKLRYINLTVEYLTMN